MKNRSIGKRALRIASVGAILILPYCAARDHSEVSQSHRNLISIDHGIRLADSILTTGSTEATVRGGCPTAVTVAPTLKHDKTETNLVFSFTWSYVGQSPSYWEINSYIDYRDGTEELRFRGGKIIRPEETLSFRSNPLEAGRLYKFELIGNSTAESGGGLVFKTITVDLRDLQVQHE